MNDVEIVKSYSDGITECGTVVIKVGKKEINLHTEEFNNGKGLYSFRVFLSNLEDNNILNLNVNSEHEILNDSFISLIRDHYQGQSMVY